MCSERLCGEEGGDLDEIYPTAHLARIKFELGKRAEAEALFAQALESSRRHWGAGSSNFIRDVKVINDSRAKAKSKTTSAILELADSR